MKKVKPLILPNKVWPFDKDEYAKLIWIGDPYRDSERQFVMDVFFNGKNKTAKIVLNWGLLPLLRLQRSYKNGIINESFSESDEVPMLKIEIEPCETLYYEKDVVIQGTATKGKSIIFKTKQKKSKQKIIIPIIELIRGLLAPNIFLLYRLLEPNTLAAYYQFERIEKNLNLNLFSTFDNKYIRTSILKDLLWLFENQEIMDMFAQCSMNYFKDSRLFFKWKYNKPISINVIATVVNGKIIVREIRSINTKKINEEVVHVFHPSFKKDNNNQTDKIAINTYDMSDTLLLTNEANGSTRFADELNVSELIYQDYEDILKLIREKVEREDLLGGNIVAHRNVNADHSFEKVEEVTATDTGGQAVAKAILLEKSFEDEIDLVDDDLNKLERTLSILQTNGFINELQVNISYLSNDLTKNKLFTTLDDGKTNRKYLTANFITRKLNYVEIIEFEQESKSLSTLIYQCSKNSEKLISIALIKLALENNGAWNNKELDVIQKMYSCKIIKAKHYKKRSIEKNSIYFSSKINEF